MRHARLALLAPLALLMSGCWWEGKPYHELRVNNRTDQVVTIDYEAVVNVEYVTDEDGDSYYEYDYADRTTTIDAGKHKTLWVPVTSTVEFEATYNHLTRPFTDKASVWQSRDVTVDVRIEDFIPAMPVANG